MDNRNLLYLQDSDGDENYHVYGVDLTPATCEITRPFEGVACADHGLESRFPERGPGVAQSP